jgi:hypothetical protein
MAKKDINNVKKDILPMLAQWPIIAQHSALLSICSKCNMIMNFKDYQETLQNQEKALEEQRKKKVNLLP